jgi:hypothetical protein
LFLRSSGCSFVPYLNKAAGYHGLPHKGRVLRIKETPYDRIRVVSPA